MWTTVLGSILAATLVAFASCDDGPAGAGQPASSPVAQAEPPASEQPPSEPPVSDATVELAARARADLAVRLGVAEDEVAVVSVEEVEWPNACLGIAEPGRMCAQVIVPGYRIVLEAAGQRYEYRANLSGTQLRYAGPVASANP